MWNYNKYILHFSTYCVHYAMIPEHICPTKWRGQFHHGMWAIYRLVYSYKCKAYFLNIW